MGAVRIKMWQANVLPKCSPSLSSFLLPSLPSPSAATELKWVNKCPSVCCQFGYSTKDVAWFQCLLELKIVSTCTIFYLYFRVKGGHLDVQSLMLSTAGIAHSSMPCLISGRQLSDHQEDDIAHCNNLRYLAKVQKPEAQGWSVLSIAPKTIPKLAA